MDGVGTPPWNSPREAHLSTLLVIAVLAGLTIAKSLGSVPYLGPLLLTGAAFLQLYLPVHRADVHEVPLSSLGLTRELWRADTRLAVRTLLIILPPYAVLFHVFMTHARPWAVSAGLQHLALWLPTLRWAPHPPTTAIGWAFATAWLVERIATHTLGVALPEEVFYRGYLQPCLQWRWPSRRTLWGTPFGGALLLTSALFALGHFLGEWNPLRFGPFIPALLFGWLRNRTGRVTAPIVVHAGCNLFVELFSRLYAAS